MDRARLVWFSIGTAVRSSHTATQPAIPPLAQVLGAEAVAGVVSSDFHQSFSEALRPHYNQQTPVVLRGILNHNERWRDAMVNWKNWEYLASRVGGERRFQAEIGSYDSGEKLDIPFGAYLEYLDYFQKLYGQDMFDKSKPTPPRDQICYMAQNDLPQGLMDEIEIPKLCSNASFHMGKGEQYQIMFWMGPSHAFSPLHYDPLDNLFFQVVGRKKVIVVDPHRVNPRDLYVGSEYGQQNNTTAVHNLENVDRAIFPKFPLLEKVATQTVLNPGDVLFLPAKWWHSMTSRDFCFSVNSWWS